MLRKMIILILILILLFYYYYYRLSATKRKISENFTSVLPKIRIGIVSMVTSQPDFEDWLFHHLEVIKVDKIYLCIENAPEIVDLVRYEPDKISYKIVDKTNQKDENNYQTQMDRQAAFVKETMKQAKEDDHIDLLFHIDADELIISPQNHDIRLDLVDIVDSSSFDAIHFQNFEAVFDLHTDQKKCFKANHFIDCSKTETARRCTSYGNGKSAAILKNQPEYYGPHYFRHRVYEMPTDKIAILHFDSCTFEAWQEKFKRQLGSNTNEIPFEFYRQSILLLKQHPQDHDKLLEFYHKNKYK